MSSDVRRGVLLAGFLVTMVGSLSVHVFMLQGLNVPYSGNLPPQGWARLPDRLLSLFGAATFYAMLPERTRMRPFWQQAALLFLLIATIHESLFRVPVMNIMTASRWTLWPFVDTVPSYIVVAAVALAIVAAGRQLGTWPRRVVATLVIGLPVYMLLAPFAKSAFAGVVAWTGPREGTTLYNPPYDWHVEVPAYVTFGEPVLAAFIIAAFVSGRIARNWRGAASLALLLIALRGQFFSTFINIRYAGTDAATAMLSFGQFTLESLTLAILTAVTWIPAIRSTEAAIVGSGAVPAFANTERDQAAGSPDATATSP